MHFCNLQTWPASVCLKTGSRTAFFFYSLCVTHYLWFFLKNIYKEWICESGIVRPDVLSQLPASPTPGAKGKSSGFNFPPQWELSASVVKGVMPQSVFPWACPWCHFDWSVGGVRDSLRQDRTGQDSEDNPDLTALWSTNHKNWLWLGFARGNFGPEVWLTLCVLKYGGGAFYRHGVKPSLPPAESPEYLQALSGAA